MKKLLYTIVSLIFLSQAQAQNVGNFYGSTDGSLSTDLKLGRKSSGGQVFNILTQDGGSAYLTFHSTRYGGGYTWSRESSGSVDRKIAYLYGASGGHYYQLFNHNQDIKVQFHSNGHSYFNGGNVGIGTTSPSEKFEVSGGRSFLFDNTGGSTHLRRNTPGGWANGYKFYGTSGSELGGFGGYGSSDALTYYYIGLSHQTPLLTVRPDGKVGIGTANPSSNFQVGNDGSTNDAILRIASSGLANKRLQFYRAGTVDAEIFEGTDEHLNMFNYFAGKDIIFGTEGTEKLRINSTGNVGIGTTTTGTHKLAVDGTIGAREIKVESGTWSDFVFEDDYDLKSLKEVESFITENKHLPEIPSEAEVSENGINLGEMDAKLLQKIEELTLYLIEQNKVLESATQKIEALEKEVGALKRGK